MVLRHFIKVGHLMGLIVLFMEHLVPFDLTIKLDKLGEDIKVVITIVRNFVNLIQRRFWHFSFHFQDYINDSFSYVLSVSCILQKLPPQSQLLL